MTPIEYREFCESTYCAPAHVNRDEYLRLLLIEEVGEVASLFAKSMRDGHLVDQARLKKELGDVLWASALLDSPRNMTSWKVDVSMKPLDALRALPNSGLPFGLACIICSSLFFSPEEVAAANVAKLKDRKSRNVLHGAGDNR